MLVAFAIAAFAWETDQVTLRGRPLADAREPANAEVDRRLDQAIAATNARTRCQADPDDTKRILASEIHRVTARSEHVDERGAFRGMGFGSYAAWLETAPIERQRFDGRTDVFGSARATSSLILGTVGVCSTIDVGGVRVGTDKIDHFWATGFTYARKSDDGERPERSVAWGTFTEATWYGRMTSNAFSYADLRANWDGERFYATLLDDGSVIGLSGDGCVARTGSFDWADWVAPEWDEGVNPPRLGRHAQRAVDQRLDTGDACRDWAEWGEDYELQLQRALAEPAPWVGPRAPAQYDSWKLHERCVGGEALGERRGP